MIRLSLRLINNFSTRINTPTIYKTQNQSISIPQYLVGNILTNQYLNAHWKNIINTHVTCAGWVRSVRSSNKIMFIELMDGTSPNSVQITIENTHPQWKKYNQIKKGYSLKVTGLLKSMNETNKNIEKYQLGITQKNEINILGTSDPAKYILSAPKLKYQTMRQHLHFRPRTLRMSAMTRIRNALSFSTHNFFQQNGFNYLHTPIITTSDCQGAGQMFHVTTLFNDKQIPMDKGSVDFSKDFFKKSAGLTVSGQLAAEAFCCGMSKVYTFGPTFRAQVSNTTRHVAEFWMIEPQFAFADLFDAMDLAESYIKYCVDRLLFTNIDDFRFLQSSTDKKDLINRTKNKLSKFERLSYTDAVALLQKYNDKFQKKVEWGCDLSTQHQRYLCENITKAPTFVYNYPINIKPFYMRVNDDGKTVASFDLLVPGIGEIIGGSQRQQRIQILEKRMEDMQINKESYQWYLDLRRFGTIPHSGFGVGFDRLVMFSTETQNIRDVIPFPRTPGNAEC